MNSKDYRIKGFMLPERRKYNNPKILKSQNPKITREKKSILRIQGFKEFKLQKKQKNNYPEIPKSVERTNYIE